ncbi:hypothetical protein D9N00_21470 [Pseudomonas syringae pv. actinidiae]|nr:hypothetical protein D9N00_21470 [Pseudomonas syringae pv. actinidiae]AYL82075.1 hypothetical protein CN228_21165 [Pseudomonas syringae pv. actinidiae str. Shaanxi_M228]
MARCGDPQISVRAKEPDEVGPETEPGGLPTLAPSIGIGGSHLAAPLPHHPACGSAPGGSRG